jgi:chemosensory pili system protein ChpA (sensor histidine kinase/response regulator)
MTHLQLLEEDSLLERVAEAQSRIAEAVEHLENADGGDKPILEAIELCIESLGIINAAAAQFGYQGLAALSRSLTEHMAARREDNQGLEPEEILELFDWTTAVGMYFETLDEPELIDALLAPLPEERKLEAREALAADSNQEQFRQDIAGQAIAEDGLQDSVAEDAADIYKQAQLNLHSVESTNDDFDLSMFAPQEATTGNGEETLLGVLLEELSQISPQLDSLAAIMAETDESGAEQAAASYLEIVGRLLTASDSLGMDGLAQIAEFVIRNVGLAMEAGGECRAAVQPLFSGWTEVVQDHLRMPQSDELCLAVVDYLEQGGWPEPLAYKDLRILLEGLTRELVVTGDYEVEARSAVAAPEDVSLELDEDANQHLVDAFLAEAPAHAEELARLVGEIMAGNQVASNIQLLQRIAHTLKGSANMLALKGVANLAHHMEDIFEYLARSEAQPPPELGLCLQEAADTLEAMLEAVQGISQPPVDAQRVLQEVLDWANRIDRGLMEADLASTDVAMAPVVVESVKQPSSANAALELLRVPRSTVDRIFKLVGETSIALGQIQERLKRLRADSGMVRSQDMVLQQRRFELENLVSVRGMATHQRRLGGTRNEFDPLELDEYDELYSSTHAFIEAVADSREVSRQMADEQLQLEDLYRQQQRLNRELQELVMSTRMVSVKTITARLQRTVRQACRATGKQAELEILGEDLLLDGDVLNKLADPLMHILRNAVDHGIEPPDERQAAGKTKAGRVIIEFSQEGNNITVRCSDDGRGLDYSKIREKAVARGLLGARDEIDNSLLTRLLLQPGFTTRDQATQVSGRGVGMDVVNTTVISLKGVMDITDNALCGTMITLRLPITLLTSHSLLIKVSDKYFAVPTATLEQILSPDAGRFQTFGARVSYQLGDDIYPARSLSELLGLKSDRDLLADNNTPVLLARVDNETYALAVNQVIASYDLVVKSLGRYVGNVHGISGVSILGDGDVVPVLDVQDLLRADAAAAKPTMRQDSIAVQSEQIALPQILIVDDSLSVRKSLTQLMQDAGLQARVAHDGVEALEIMRKYKPDLLLTDLEMPRMNGLELCAHIRASEETRNLPVIMVTSRTMQKHHQEAKHAGVDLYITKPFTEDDLVKDVHAMLGVAA